MVPTTMVPTLLVVLFEPCLFLAMGGGGLRNNPHPPRRDLVVPDCDPVWRVPDVDRHPLAHRLHSAARLHRRRPQRIRLPPPPRGPTKRMSPNSSSTGVDGLSKLFLKEKNTSPPVGGRKAPPFLWDARWGGCRGWTLPGNKRGIGGSEGCPPSHCAEFFTTGVTPFRGNPSALPRGDEPPKASPPQSPPPPFP